MKVSKKTYEKIDAISKISGLILVAISIDNVSKGNYFIALFLFGIGGMVSIVPLFLKVITGEKT